MSIWGKLKFNFNEKTQKDMKTSKQNAVSTLRASLEAVSWSQEKIDDPAQTVNFRATEKFLYPNTVWLRIRVDSAKVTGLHREKRLYFKRDWLLKKQNAYEKRN